MEIRELDCSYIARIVFEAKNDIVEFSVEVINAANLYKAVSVPPLCIFSLVHYRSTTLLED